jgi:hypothetical protein
MERGKINFFYVALGGFYLGPECYHYFVVKYEEKLHLSWFLIGHQSVDVDEHLIDTLESDDDVCDP